MPNVIITPPLMMSALAMEAFKAALDIGSDNWDSYLEPNRWPSLMEDARYKKFAEHIGELEKLADIGRRYQESFGRMKEGGR